MFCPECGTRNPEENRFCGMCGERLPDRTERAASKKPGAAAIIPPTTRVLDTDTVKTRVKVGVPVRVHYSGAGDNMVVDRVVVDQD